jgi:hypothetical protein
MVTRNGAASSRAATTHVCPTVRLPTITGASVKVADVAAANARNEIIGDLSFEHEGHCFRGSFREFSKSTK